MTLDEIKQAVRDGHTVCWSNTGYEVRYSGPPDADLVTHWNIVFVPNGNATGLTWLDGIHMNGYPDDFFIKEGT